MAPKSLQSPQTLPKWSQNRSQNLPKINENSNFIQNQKTFKNTVLSSIFKGSTLPKSSISGPSDPQKTSLKQEPLQIHPKLALFSTKMPSGTPSCRCVVDFASNLGGQGGGQRSTFFSLVLVLGAKMAPRALPRAPRALPGAPRALPGAPRPPQEPPKTPHNNDFY